MTKWKISNSKEIGSNKSFPVLIFGDFSDTDFMVAIYYDRFSDRKFGSTFVMDIMGTEFTDTYTGETVNELFKKASKDEDVSDIYPQIIKPSKEELDLLEEEFDKYVLRIQRRKSYD